MKRTTGLVLPMIFINLSENRVTPITYCPCQEETQTPYGVENFSNQKQCQTAIAMRKRIQTNPS